MELLNCNIVEVLLKEQVKFGLNIFLGQLRNFVVVTDRVEHPPLGNLNR
jgi:hypothetical protein